MAAVAAKTIYPTEDFIHGYCYKEVEGQATKEQLLLEHVKKTAPAGNPGAVIDAIDAYAWDGNFFMNVGDIKGKIVDDEIKAKNPKVALELGAYCGYSSIRMAQFMEPGSKLYSIEFMERNAAVARGMAEHAGVSDKVEYIIGTLTTTGLEGLKERGVTSLDFVFIDHHKDHYLSDLLALKESGLLKKGTVIVADNVLFPGAPAYLAHVREATDLKTVEHKTKSEYSTERDDIVTVSVYEPAV
eukprot:jgi/Mesen1/929/ME000118S00106